MDKHFVLGFICIILVREDKFIGLLLLIRIGLVEVVDVVVIGVVDGLLLVGVEVKVKVRVVVKVGVKAKVVVVVMVVVEAEAVVRVSKDYSEFLEARFVGLVGFLVEYLLACLFYKIP